MTQFLNRVPWLWLFFVAAVAYALVPGANDWTREQTGQVIGPSLTTIFVYAILALGLNVVVGNAGLLHLGIGAFFGIGAFITGIMTVAEYPIQAPFIACVLVSTLGSAALAVLLSSPVLRLRGDYFALVTLGFGEVLRFTLRNLEEITAGTKGLKPIPAPWHIDIGGLEWFDYRTYYFFALAFLALVLLVLRNLEKSEVGRAWVSLREDELAAACMGLNVARLKLGAIALGAGVAGLAGCLYAFVQRNTADPDQFGFTVSIMMICCLILGGVGNRAGVILGVMLVLGYDNILSQIVDTKLQAQILDASDAAGEVRFFGVRVGNTGSPYLNFSGWRLAVFGLALIVVMRFRPSGLLPAVRGSGKEV